MGSSPGKPFLMMKTLLILFCICAFHPTTLSLPQSYGKPAPAGPAKYAYQYKVNDDYANVNFGQAESRDGYTAQGEYFVNLPDGRLQKVTYSVNGDGGYVADVQYTGTAQYPPEPAGGYGRK